MSSADEHLDSLAAFRAAADQFQAATEALAQTVAAYHNALLLQGLERHEALELTVQWQAMLLMNITAGGQEEG